MEARRDSYNQGITIENDAILPAQFFAGTRSRGLRPEEQLQLSIVEQAVTELVYEGQSRQLARIADAAEAWFLDEEEDYPFAFAAICAYFDWPTERLRAAILAIKHRGGPNAVGRLPRGVNYEERSRTRYRVVTYVDGKQQVHRFLRLAEACAFVAQTRQSDEGVDWPRYPVRIAGSRLIRAGSRCRICNEKILLGQAYREANRSGRAHDICVQGGDDGHQERVSDSAREAGLAA